MQRDWGCEAGAEGAPQTCLCFSPVLPHRPAVPLSPLLLPAPNEPKAPSSGPAAWVLQFYPF